MASITIRNLDEGLKKRLRMRAARKGHSMEKEVREILNSVLNEAPNKQGNLGSAIRAQFAHLGGVELPQIPREPIRKPIEFD